MGNSLLPNKIGSCGCASRLAVPTPNGQIVAVTNPANSEAAIDPAAPRDAVRVYPAGVTVIQRSQRGRSCVPATSTIEELQRWLLLEAAGERELLLTFEALMWRMNAAGLPIDRATLHIGTLHPQLLGFAWNWRSSDGLCDEVQVQQSTADTDAFKLNPLRRIFDQGSAIRRNPQDPAAQAEFPIMRDLAAGGYTEYLALPLGGEGFRHAVTLSTIRPGGFSDDQLAEIKRVLVLLTLHVERHIAVRISTNALGAYLGPVAATKVLNGDIKRGSGEPIRAIIWVSDMRGFTDLSDRLSGWDTITVLNAYFEVFVGAVLAQGGEVLKFIGDGLLAVFPLGDDGCAAGNAALAAAQAAQAGLARLNTEPPAGLAEVEGWRPLRAGIALHEGEVFFGNIGAPNRLDFTVIGPAVNEASRVEALQKTLGRNILITAAAARYISLPLEPLGEHPLRGVAAPMTILTPPEQTAVRPQPAAS
ncbi:adenylate/guanylate cyclase domain-containing protein [Rhodopseudomonas sp. HC1]|uniref:adenylate/guanylate cyclase domain-containing protein n=1 Tax=Rhodopseudomonas infernalis TaxID=2897386 RepID=UPI001EE7A689|nr:adenylate/guanylate cyclase domain-containing protein [Rhodopseudomonas infernalis]MCG6205330.1 adenylate/guanylate cyclase domain-containing protein [Rhodopseudomonas infernalis]